jgi:hypothetical protein
MVGISHDRGVAMAARLDVEVRPKTKLSDATRASQRLVARLNYTRQPGDASSRTPLTIPGTISAEPNIDGEARFSVEDGQPESAAELRIETAQGTALILVEAKFPADGKAAGFTFEVPAPTYRQAGDPAEPPPTPCSHEPAASPASTTPCPTSTNTVCTWRRCGRNSCPVVGPTRSRLRRTLLGLDAHGDITEFEVTMLDPATADPAAANAMGLRDCSVRADGTFQFSLPVAGDEIGWFWLLLGPTSYMGYQVDPVDRSTDGRTTIVLPPVDAKAQTPFGGGSAAPNGSRPPLNSTSDRSSTTLPNSLTTPAPRVRRSPILSGSSASARSSPFCGSTNPKSAETVR